MLLVMTVRPPLTLAGDDALDQGAFVERLLEVVPGGDALGLVARQAGLAETVFQCLDGDDTKSPMFASSSPRSLRNSSTGT
jgi:hypothetical protein